MNKIRVSYKLDRHVHDSLKSIIKSINISSFSHMIKHFCDEHFSSNCEFKEDTAIILASANLYKYKNANSYYIFLTNAELEILNKVAKTYGLSQSELISKILVNTYDLYYVTVDIGETLLINEYETKYKNKSMPFFIRVNQEQYDILKENTDLCKNGPTNLVYILLEEAFRLCEKNKAQLLKNFSGYNDSKEKKYIIRANIPIKYYLRFLKFSYSISETPYSIFNKMLYYKIKDIEIV